MKKDCASFKTNVTQHDSYYVVKDICFKNCDAEWGQLITLCKDVSTSSSLIVKKISHSYNSIVHHLAKFGLICLVNFMYGLFHFFLG